MTYINFPESYPNHNHSCLTLTLTQVFYCLFPKGSLDCRWYMKQNTVKSSSSRFWHIPQLQCTKCPLGVSAWQREDNKQAGHSACSCTFTFQLSILNVRKVNETKKNLNIHSFDTHENLISLSSVVVITNEGGCLCNTTNQTSV